MKKKQITIEDIRATLEKKIAEYEVLSEDIELLGRTYLTKRSPEINLMQGNKNCPNCRRRYLSIKGLIKHVFVCDDRLDELVENEVLV